MALDRQVELAMDAMQASHDAMLGHMALIRESLSQPAEPEQEMAGGPGSGRRPDRAIYNYQSIFDQKSKVPPPTGGPTGVLKAAPPGFELDEQGNYTRIKEGEADTGMQVAQDSSYIKDITGLDKEGWFKKHPPPEGDKEWQGLSDKERQDLMWDTGVVSHADPVLNSDKKTNINSILDMLNNPNYGGRIRGQSDIPAFKDYEDSVPAGVNFYHLKDGTTIIHKPTEGEGPKVSGGMQVAGDVVGIPRESPVQLWNVEKPAGYQAADPGTVAKAYMRGSLKILKPTPQEEK